MRASELTEFKELLLKKRRILLGDVNVMQKETLNRTRQEASGDLSKMPRDMADVGTDNFAQDMTLGFIESEEETLREIDSALQRIQAKTYAQCVTCSKSITKTRLRAKPQAKLCIKCKRLEEQGLP